MNCVKFIVLLFHWSFGLGLITSLGRGVDVSFSVLISRVYVRLGRGVDVSFSVLIPRVYVCLDRGVDVSFSVLIPRVYVRLDRGVDVSFSVLIPRVYVPLGRGVDVSFLVLIPRVYVRLGRGVDVSFSVLITKLSVCGAGVLDTVIVVPWWPKISTDAGFTLAPSDIRPSTTRRVWCSISSSWLAADRLSSVTTTDTLGARTSSCTAVVRVCRGSVTILTIQHFCARASKTQDTRYLTW